MSTPDAVLLGIVGGEPLVYVGPDLSEGLPPRVLEGLVRRRLIGTGQMCPCGAAMPRPNRAQRRAARGHVLVVEVEHQDDCPAVCGELLAGRWGA